MMKLPLAKSPWAARTFATAAVCAVVALWGGGPLHAQDTGITPARQSTGAQSAPAPASSGGEEPSGQAALVYQVQTLQEQTRDLLGQVEQLQHRLDQLKEINKEQYVALDTRIKRLESGQTAPAEGASSAPAEPGETAAADTAASAESTPAPSASAPASAGSSAPDRKDAQQAYETAFDALREGDFVTSSRGFRAFVKQYPHDKLAPNAWYWLGESYYVTQNYKQARDAFQAVLKRFPQSDKAAGALLKKGYAQHALKEDDAARKTLQSVIDKYPGSSEAKLAKQRLHDMRLQQQLD